jgi:hypothetical protein
MFVADYNVTAVKSDNNHMLLRHDGRYIAALQRGFADQIFSTALKKEN